MSSHADRLLVDLAVRNHLISEAEGQECLGEAAAAPGTVGQILVAKRYVKERHLKSLEKKSGQAPRRGRRPGAGRRSGGGASSDGGPTLSPARLGDRRDLRHGGAVGGGRDLRDAGPGQLAPPVGQRGAGPVRPDRGSPPVDQPGRPGPRAPPPGAARAPEPVHADRRDPGAGAAPDAAAGPAGARLPGEVDLPLPGVRAAVQRLRDASGRRAPPCGACGGRSSRRRARPRGSRSRRRSPGRPGQGWPRARPPRPSPAATTGARRPRKTRPGCSGGPGRATGSTRSWGGAEWAPSTGPPRCRCGARWP